jgi:hypothetical protein
MVVYGRNSGGERAERSVAIVVHKSVVRSVVKKIVRNEEVLQSQRAEEYPTRNKNTEG